MSHPLDCIFRPASIAVVGASSDPTKRGHHAVRALQASGFSGRVHPVNPKGGEILGLPVATSVEEIPEAPELALICTPARTVPGVLEECGRAGVRGAVILAVGFGESDEEGRRLEARVREVARESGVRVVGPNTSGILNLHHGLNLIGAPDVPAGDVAFLVQSGNVALSLMLEIADRGGRGISICASVGNEAGVGFHEYLEYLEQDEHTRVVVVYAEGFQDTRAFLTAASRATAAKPVVLLKGGRSDAGRAAARSHTGAVSGPYALFSAGLRQAGVVEVTRGDELLPVAGTLAGQPASPPGRGVVILSDGGGQGTLAADALTGSGIELAELGAGTRERLRELLGRAAAVANPVDLAGRADAEPGVFARTLEILLDAEETGVVLVVGLFGGYHLRFAEELEPAEVEAARGIVDLARVRGRPVVVHTMYAERASPPLDVLRDGGVPVLGSLDVACRAVGALVERRPHGGGGWDPAGWEPLQEGGSDGESTVTALTEPEAREMVGRAGIPVAPGRFCAGEEEVRDGAAALTSPLVAKVVSPGIPHKTEAGGVILGIEDGSGAVEAYRSLMERGRAYLAGEAGPHEPDGVLLCEMLPEPPVELLLGVRRDPELGAVATVGLGGVAVEVLGDVSHRVLPVERADVLEMLDELRAASLLGGVRGGEGIDREAVAGMLLGLARILHDEPGLRELEMNPVFAYPDRAVAVDVRAFVDSGRADGA